MFRLLSQAHGPSVDNWACGVLLFVLLAGYTPFAHEDEHTMYELIRTGNFNFTQSSVWEDVSADAKDLIEKFLTVDEKQRMTAERALASHPWLRNASPSRNGDSHLPRDSPTTPRVHLDNVQKNLQKERDTGKLFKGAVNAVLAINRVQNALANGDKDLITLKSGAAGGPGAPRARSRAGSRRGNSRKGPCSRACRPNRRSGSNRLRRSRAQIKWTCSPRWTLTTSAIGRYAGAPGAAGAAR